MPKITTTPSCAQETRCLSLPLGAMVLVALAALACAVIPATLQAAGDPTLERVALSSPRDSIGPWSGPQLDFTPAITLTKRDTLATDVDEDAKADPGDVLTYTIVIRNEVTAATGAVLTDALDVNTALIEGSLKTTPLAVNEAYPCTGNVGINVPSESGLLLNDRDIDGGPITVTPILAGATAQGGAVTVTVAGGFTYVPAPGFVGTDVFTYTATDDEGEADFGTVSISVTEGIWFVNNTAGGANLGTLDHPFTSLASFQVANDGVGLHPGDNDRVFLYSGVGDYTGGVTLRAGQRLLGQGATGSTLAALADVSVSPFGYSLPGIDGVRPAIVNASGTGVSLNNGNIVRGLNVGNSSVFAIRNTGVLSTGNLSILEVAVTNTLGGGVYLGNGGNVDVRLTSLTTTAGANGVYLGSLSGTFDSPAGSISSATSTGFVVEGGNATVAYSGTIASLAGRSSVIVQNRTGGAVTLTGNITDNGLGVVVQNNAGTGSVTFSGASKVLSTGSNQAVTLHNNATTFSIRFVGGGLDIDTTSGTAFGTLTSSSPTGGTVIVTGDDNTLTSSTGHALYLRNATLGAGGLVFRSIASNGGSTAGIYLQDTGVLAGLTVTGNGGTCTGPANCTGGSIQNKTGDGIYLSNTMNPSFTRVNVSDNAGNGIFGRLVNGIVLDTSYVSNNGDAVTECGVRFSDTNTDAPSANGLRGTGVGGSNPTRITSSTIRSSGEFNLFVLNISDTLAELYLQNSTFSDTSLETNGADGFLIETRSSAVATVRAEGCTFSSNSTQGIQGSALDTSALTVRVTGSTFSSNNEGIVLSNASNSDLTFEVGTIAAPNSFSGHLGVAIAVNNATSAGSGSDYSGKVIGNTITGLDGMLNRALVAFLAGGGQSTLQVSNNTLTNITNFEGIWIQNGEVTGDSVIGNVTVTNNNVTMAASGSYAIQVQSRQSANLCANITGNTAMSGGGLAGIYVRQRDTSTYRLPGYSGAAGTAPVVQFIQDNNPGTTAAATVTTAFTGGGACMTP